MCPSSSEKPLSGSSPDRHPTGPDKSPAGEGVPGFAGWCRVGAGYSTRQDFSPSGTGFSAPSEPFAGFAGLAFVPSMIWARVSRSIGITTSLKSHPTNPTRRPQGGVYALSHRKNSCRVSRPTGTRHHPTRGWRVGSCRVLSGRCRVKSPTRFCLVQDGVFGLSDPPCRVCRVGFWPCVFTHPSPPECGGSPGRPWPGGRSVPTPPFPGGRGPGPLPPRS